MLVMSCNSAYITTLRLLYRFLCVYSNVQCMYTAGSNHYRFHENRKHISTSLHELLILRRRLILAEVSITTHLPAKEGTAGEAKGTTRYTQALRRPAVACCNVLPVSSNKSPGPMALSARYQRPLGSNTCHQQAHMDIKHSLR